MKRQNYKVLVADKKQAKQFKQALLALGEVIDEDYWIDEHLYPQNELKYLSGCGWLVSSENDLKEITFKELLTLLVTQVEQPKPGLLDGKCAIQVSNEREFKLLMEHYSEKGWESITSQQPNEVTYNNFSHSPYISYNNKFNNPNSDRGVGQDYKGVSYDIADYKIIPFSDFAAGVGIKVPVFVLKSVDGVDLYSGMEMYGAVYNPSLKNWKIKMFGDEPFILNEKSNVLDEDEDFPYVTSPDTNKAFSTREAAESWISEKNKPKEIIVRHNDSETSTITKDKVVITSFDKGHAYSSLHLHGKAIEEIYAALNALQN